VVGFCAHGNEPCGFLKQNFMTGWKLSAFQGIPYTVKADTNEINILEGARV
jgi:hypothetical protein